jgi:hypothetical protein
MGDVVSLEEYRKRRFGEQARRARAKPGSVKHIVSPGASPGASPGVSPGISPGVSTGVSTAQKSPVKEPAERKTEAADDQPKS